MRLSLNLIIVLIVISSFGLVYSAGNVFSTSQYQNKFVDWMREHKKFYGNKEFLKKYESFKENMDLVHKWNEKGDSPTVLGLNAHADLTNDEYRTQYLGTRATVKLNKRPRVHPALKQKGLIGRTQTVQSIDWREKGMVTPVKDQGSCGSCYSFSTTGAIEGANAIANGGNLVSLSEQQILDCSSSYENQGCDGGLMVNSFEYVIDNNGIMSESAYPYETKVNDQCSFKSNQVAAKIKSYQEIEAGDEADLQKAVLLGPVSIAIDASQPSFQLYKSGVYFEPSCSSEELDHGVLIVGMGTENGNDYYIVKNSWNSDWGLQGYILMSRDKNNNCGVATMASYPIV